MRPKAATAISCLFLAGCAATPPAPAVTAAPPLIPATTAVDSPFAADPYRRPQILAWTPPAWGESASRDEAPGADIVYVHESGKALIAVTLRNTGDVALADHAERMVAAITDGNVTTSLIVSTASGDMAWFSWTRHPAKLRPVAAQGRVVLVRFPTQPERMIVVSGIWPPETSAAMTADIDRIARSAALR